MKLWNKEDILNKKVEEFTVGDDRNSDMFLAKYDVIASIAHAKMLSKTKIICKNESQLLIKELKSIKNKILKNEFRIEEQFEDIHSKNLYLF
jgi:argininosuccinate lyase